MSVHTLLPLVVLAPLLGAAITILARSSITVQRVVALLATLVHLGASVALVVIANSGPRATQMGGWPAPFGITLVIDRAAAMVLVAASVVFAAVLVYAIAEPGAEDDHAAFLPAYLVLVAGVSLTLVTGDLFNLFVALEMTLASSFLLLTVGGSLEQVRRGTTYVVVSLVSSALFLLAAALTYAATGTLNLADLVGRLAVAPPGVRLGILGLLLVVFGIKSAVFPLFFWLPDSYPVAPGPITAVFAGLLTKVGVVVMIRLATLLPDPAERPGGLLLTVGALTMVVGGLGAVAQDEMKRILSFHIVSQIGYMIVGLGLFTVAGVGAALFFVVHQVLVKTALFLVAGVIDMTDGTGRLSVIGGLVRRMPGVAVIFLLAALNLAGLPPLAGFIGKLGIVRAGIDAEVWLPTAVAVLASMLTLFSMVKIWAGAFWGEPAADHVPVRERAPRLMVAAAGVLVAVTVGLAIAAGPVVAYSRAAATELMDRTPYVDAVDAVSESGGGR